MRNLLQIVMVVLVCFWLAVPLQAQEFAPFDSTNPMVAADFPSLESISRIQGPLTFCGEKVPLHLPDVRERIEKEVLLIHWDRAQALLWIKRSGRYFPHIERLLEAKNMPDDLKYLPVIESSLLPNAGSNKGARGIWQFIPGTGRKYGLEVDRYIDERRNFYLSTEAAMRYLTDLYGRFNSWSLAAAAYNMGENGLEKAIKKQDIRDYYQLDLSTETERYVIRAIATKLLLSNPDKYGFRLKKSDYYQPVQFDRIRLRCRDYTPLLLVAKAAQTTYKGLRDMNPQLIRDRLPHGSHLLFIPKGVAQDFGKRYKPLIKSYRAKHSKAVVHTVRRGENLHSIAKKYRVSLKRLMKLNKLNRKSTIHPGQKLTIKP